MISHALTSREHQRRELLDAAREQLVLGLVLLRALADALPSRTVLRKSPQS